MTCPGCGFANANGSRFCGNCGSALAARTDDVVRKTVTIVFIDLAGSTALGERLDPEVFRTVLGRYFTIASAALERHGGTVEKFIGDAVMAVFGVPLVREDDALRAVRAAAAVRTSLDELNRALEHEHGERLHVRIGVNTGEVVVGGSGSASDQRLATGDAVNVAARLEQAAAPDEILLGARTYEAVRHASTTTPIPPIVAKGKREPLRAWRLDGVRSDAPAFERSTTTPFVGRRDELDRLRGGFDAAIAERACRMATIVATPGSGKSRLAREFLRSIAAEARVLVARCIADGQGSAYGPLADIVREVAGDDDPLSGLASLLAGTDRGALAARVVADTVGALDDAGTGGSPEETAWAFRRLFEALATQRPLALLVDDIHWADPGLLDLLEYLLGFSSGVPFFIVCLARPDLFDARPSWATPRADAVLVALAPLPADDAAQLVDGLRPDQPLPPALRRRILESAEGNPLFVEQMLAMLADDPDAAADAVPATIHALLAARLDRLPHAERAVLQRAAVEGRHFHSGALADRFGPATSKELPACLLALMRKEFVRPDRASVAGDDGFRFQHALIRDVAYASLTKESRARAHAELADWLERRAAALPAHDEIVGHHLEQAHRYRQELGHVDDATRELARRAGRRLASAGRRLLDRHEAAVASSLLERASRLLDGEDPERLELLPELARALRMHGSIEAAERAANATIDAGRRAGNALVEQRGHVERVCAMHMRMPLEPDAIRTVALAAIAVFEDRASETDLADAWHLMGLADLSAGDRKAQLQTLRRAREHAIASGDVQRQMDAWNEVGGAMIFGSTPVDECIAFTDDELAWARERGLLGLEADALLAGPYLYARLGKFDEARTRLARSKALCRELGLRYGLAEAHSAGAQMELLAEDPVAAERELRDAIAVVTAMGAMRYVSVYSIRLAHVLLTLGRDDEARMTLAAERERASAASRTALAKLAAARLAARRASLVEAVALTRDASASSAGSDDLTLRAEMQVFAAEVFDAAGDRAAARAALVEALALNERKGNAVAAQRCRELLERRVGPEPGALESTP